MEYYRKAKMLFLSKGRSAITEFFPYADDRLAAGLVGQGSECFGYDDVISADHDFVPGFCIWLSDEDYARYGSTLQDVYDSLIREEYPDSVNMKTSAGAIRRRGVFTVDGFYESLIGCPGVPQNNMVYMAIPQYALAEATNGWVFEDESGEFSAIRRELLKGYPEDVRKAKLASSLLLMAQSGQYNFQRCVNHGEESAAVLALSTFVRESIKAAFLLEHSYAPYYKWAFRRLRELPGMNMLDASLEYILLGSNEGRGVAQKIRAVERVASYFTSRLRDEGLSSSGSDYLEPHAYEVREKIADGSIRNTSIFSE